MHFQPGTSDVTECCDRGEQREQRWDIAEQRRAAHGPTSGADDQWTNVGACG
jgi:hypothetical protein